MKVEEDRLAQERLAEVMRQEKETSAAVTQLELGTHPPQEFTSRTSSAGRNLRVLHLVRADGMWGEWPFLSSSHEAYGISSFLPRPFALVCVV